MEALKIDDSGHALIAAMEEKYFDLVWHARKSPLEDAEYWSDTPAEIKTAAGNEMAKVEEMFPDEVDVLKCPDCGDWNNGFNSGMLASNELLSWRKVIQHRPHIARSMSDLSKLKNACRTT